MARAAACATAAAPRSPCCPAPEGRPGAIAEGAALGHSCGCMAEPETQDEDWTALLAVRDGGRLPSSPLGELFAPVLAPPAAADGCRVVGRLAQTLDGRIATAGG